MVGAAGDVFLMFFLPDAVLFPFSGCKCRKNNFITVMVMHEKNAQIGLKNTLVGWKVV